MDTPCIHIIANATLGKVPALSGGDRIFIECAKRWAEAGYKIKIYLWEEGMEICKRNNLNNVEYVLWTARKFRNSSFFLLYVYRIIKGCREALKIKLEPDDIVYSASDFWQDSIPGLIMKLKNQIRWVVAIYLFAPNPFIGYKEKGKFKIPSIRNILFFLSQKPIIWSAKKFADAIFVTNELDREKFIPKVSKRRSLWMKEGRYPEEIKAVIGGVDTKPAKEYLKTEIKEEKEYDGCFVGRFHPQKGVLELIDIWEIISQEKPDSKLALIGVGELENEIKRKIFKKKLESNIILFGFKDGEEKYDIFKKSKIILHPAIYDSGGMAAAEAFAWGLPGVGFNLSALKSYYPKGMLKAPVGDLKAFANLILVLLNNEDTYNKIRNDAMKLADEWDWDIRAKDILKSMIETT